MTKEQRKKRQTAGTAAVIFVFVLLVCILVKVQLIDGAQYRAAGANLAVSQTTVKASRGEILDCNGEPLVTNRQGYSVIFKYSDFPSAKNQQERNELIFSLISLFEQDGADWIDRLPLKYNKKGKLVVDKDKQTEFEYMVSESMLEMPNGTKTSANDCLKALIERYSLEDYSEKDARKIASVCFGMKYLSFSNSAPYVFAEDATAQLVSKIKENDSVFRGVDAESMSYREYSDTTHFSHLLGVVGSINSDEYEAENQKLTERLSDETLSTLQRTLLENNAYTLNDKYGKSGIESLMEQYLRGTNGIKTTTTSSDGEVTEDYLIKPQQGATVVTTIRKDLQVIASEALEKMLRANRQSSFFGTAGALVVENIKTGEILACVSLPTYDITKYFTDYSSLANDSMSPLWNRALQSAYAPGSTMKPVMALAGLQEKVITPTSTFYCGMDYELEDITLHCLSLHGYIGVYEAIEKSCNIYFYELGRKLGIDKMNKYSTLFGLGQKTGIELPESAGMLASIANKEANGQVWNPGDTVQAAIGQSDNLFSPVQLVNYCATIANGGTRYRPYLIKAVLSSDMSSIISETQPEVLNTVNIGKKNFDIVKEGMHRVLIHGGCSEYFKDCIVDAAGKTGTSQLKRTTEEGTVLDCNNGFFISYAPYDDPEIAVAVVAENVNSGSGISKAAVDVYNYYFSQKTEFAKAGETGRLIP